MTTNDSDRENGHDNSIEVEPRTRRALIEPLSVVTLDGTPVESRDETIVMVVSASGESYHVDAREGRCECPDHTHRDVDCKHIRRSRVALGLEPVDSSVLATVDVDENLGANAPGPRVATSDGGVVEADGEEETDDGRPADCECGEWNDGLGLGLPCWPCYREGFETPASATDD